MDQSHNFPPFRMKAATAAYYSGMSITQFRNAVAEGELPPGRKGIGGRYWLRAELEEAMVESDTVKPHDFAQKI